MPIATIPQIRMIQVGLTDPLGLDETISPYLYWSTQAGDFETDLSGGNFQVQVSTSNLFTTTIFNQISFLDQSNFQYESSPGTWVAFPSTGLLTTDFGKNVRYKTNGLAVGTYFWRVRPLQQV